jgi:hypothetical protein
MPDTIGNTFSTATAISVTPGKYSFDRTEQVGSSDLLDIYKFTLAGKSSFSAAAVDLTGDVSLTLFSGTTAIATSNSNSSTGSETLSTDLAAGTYYLQISANNSPTSDYRLLFETQSTPKANVVWRNVISGVNAAWQLNGSNITGVETYTPITDPTWTMVGVSDFNGDGETDYLWRQASTGTTAIWAMRNGSIGQGYYLPTRDSSWSVNLATDLNNDGKGDILWQNNLGQNLVWYMDSGTVIGSDNLFAVGDRNWRMEAAGDFNYDGKTDLLWRNYASGENAAWLMNGNQITGTMSFLTINDRNWTIEGAGDFNDDGKVDLLWHHTSGLNVTWNLNGSAIISSTSLLPVADPSWQIIGVGRRFETPVEADLPGSNSTLALNLGDITGLTAGGSVRVGGSVSNSDPTDYYRFTLTGATIVDMVLDSAIDSVQLVTPNGSTIQQGGTSSQTLQAGTYYLQVNPAATGKANYFLNLTARNPNIKVPSNITVTSPNGGETLRPGASINLTWSDNIAENVRIDLYKGNILAQTIVQSVTSNGLYSWILPTNLVYGSDYQLRITSVIDSTVSDFSNQVFSIGSTFNIQFDYRFDSSNWYTTARRAALDAAADFWERIILDEFVDTPIGTGVPFVKNPTTDQNIGVNNIFTTDVAIDDLLVFVGSLDIPGTTLAYAGPSGFYDNDTRYVGEDFEPRIGSLTFDNATNWFIDSTPGTRNDIPASQFDFIGTAIHELGHILGFSRGIYAFDRHVVNGVFMGPNAKRVNGGLGVPLSTDGHIQEGYTYSNYGESSLDPTTMAGVRQLPTLLDMAILDDVGYTINYAMASNN